MNRRFLLSTCIALLATCFGAAIAQEAKREPMVPDQGAKFTPIQIDTTGDGWVELGKDDFQRANCDEET
ncbi:MAG: hypothetical protein ACKOAU_07765, partial [Pirellula sp.]